MSRRALLVAALALMAGGLLLGGIGLVIGGGATPVWYQQPLGPNGNFGPNGQQGPERGLRPGPPAIGRETERGEAPEKPFPAPAASPRPKATATP